MIRIKRVKVRNKDKEILTRCFCRCGSYPRSDLVKCSSCGKMFTPKCGGIERLSIYEHVTFSRPSAFCCSVCIKTDSEYSGKAWTEYLAKQELLRFIENKNSSLKFDALISLLEFKKD